MLLNKSYIENQLPPKLANITPVDTPTIVTSDPTSEQKPKKKMLPAILVTLLLSATLFGSGGYYLGTLEIDDTILDPDVAPTQTPTATPSPSPSNQTYTSDDISFSYPPDWQVLGATNTPSAFEELQTSGKFDHIVVLQKDAYYVAIGIYNSIENVGNIGGIFKSEEKYQDSLAFQDEVRIGGDIYLLWKGDNPLTNLTGSDRPHGGLASSISMSKYIPNKVTNSEGVSVNGYDQDFVNGNNTYLVFKFSDEGHDTTPQSVQSEIISILETITW